MPYKSKGPCKYPGCLSREDRYGYCKAHYSIHTAIRAARDSAWKARKLSTSEEERQLKKFYRSKIWLNLRRLHLNAHPVCVQCKRPGRVVDHITPIKAGGDRVDPANLQTMCDRCHNTKRSREAREYGSVSPASPAAPRHVVYIVIGPPAGGKSTYTSRNRLRGEWVWDTDKMMDCVGASHETRTQCIAPLIAARDAALEVLLDGRGPLTAYVEVSRVTTEQMKAWSERGAVLLATVPPWDTLKRRLADDPTRAAAHAQWASICEQWYNDWKGKEPAFRSFGGKFIAQE